MGEKMTTSSEPEPKPKYLTQSQVARELSCSVATVRNMVDSGELVGIKLGPLPKSGVRVSRESFIAFCQRAEAEYAKRIGKTA